MTATEAAIAERARPGGAPRLALAGKSALVTGAARGIGRAIAEAFLADGARVLLLDRDPEVESLAGRLQEAGFAATSLVCDLAAPQDLDRAVREATDSLGRIDILVNNAGILLLKPALEIERAEWERIVDVNLSACFFLSQAVARSMVQAGGGRIINLGSIVGQRAQPGLAPYIAAKGGLHALTRSLAADLGGTGISVNAIAPGFIETEMTRGTKASYYEHVRRSVPAGRWGRPEDIAAVAVFLASDAAGYVNGQIICVDGGLTACAR